MRAQVLVELEPVESPRNPGTLLDDDVRSLNQALLLIIASARFASDFARDWRAALQAAIQTGQMAALSEPAWRHLAVANLRTEADLVALLGAAASSGELAA